MAFPAGPYTDGQTHTEAGINYTYSAATGGWLKPAASAGTNTNVAGTVQGVSITGATSLTGGGDLSADRTIQLVGDSATPAANTYYGVQNIAGYPKGFQPMSNFWFNNAGTYVSTDRALNTINSLEGGGPLTTHTGIQLVNDVAAPGPHMAYGTVTGGVRAWKPIDQTVDPSGVPLTRAIGSSPSIRMLNVGGANESLTKSLFPQLVGDSAAPGSRRYYGTNSSGTKGWHSTRLPAWIDMIWGSPGTSIAATTTATGRLALNGTTGDYAFNSTATALFNGRAQRVSLTVQTDPGRIIYAYLGAYAAILTGGMTDANGFWTGTCITIPTANNWVVSIRNAGSQAATIQYLRLHFKTID